MLPDLSSAKWSIDDKNKIMTIDDITFPIKANDYIGKSEPKYLGDKKQIPSSLIRGSLIFGFLFWVIAIFGFFYIVPTVDMEHNYSFLESIFSFGIIAIFYILAIKLKNIFLKFIFFILMLGSILLFLDPISKKYVNTIFIIIALVIIFHYIKRIFIKKINRIENKLKQEFYSSDNYKKEYYERRIKPYILYEYLKKKIPIYSELKDNQELIESDNFKSDNIDVLMSKIYVKAFLLDATAIVINQNNISNEVNGHVNGYVNTTPNGQVYGSTKGKIETKTTHFANVSFVRNKER